MQYYSDCLVSKLIESQRKHGNRFCKQVFCTYLRLNDYFKIVNCAFYYLSFNLTEKKSFVFTVFELI